MGEGLQARPCRAGKVLVFQGRAWRPPPIKQLFPVSSRFGWQQHLTQ